MESIPRIIELEPKWSSIFANSNPHFMDKKTDGYQGACGKSKTQVWIPVLLTLKPVCNLSIVYSFMEHDVFFPPGVSILKGVC